MKTKEQAFQDSYSTYYLCRCEYCGKEYVISQEEMNGDFFGKPECGPSESAWKCPNCGHVNKMQNKDLCPCYQDGGTNIRFELNDTESERARDFMKEHNHREDFKRQGKMLFSALGMQFTYKITPGGLGPVVGIRCNECGEAKEITDTNSW